MWSYVKIIIWGLLWYPVWLVTLPWRKHRNNCLIWALEKFDNEGGYLVIRWCRSNSVPFIQWPHFLWLPPQHHIYLQHIVPEDETHDQHLFPAPWFVPITIQGDPEDEIHDN